MNLPPLSLYIHFPWCLRRCPYCDFNAHAVKAGHKGVELSLQQRYLNALMADLKQSVTPETKAREIKSIFIGGGTPSLIEPDLLAKFLEELQTQLILAPHCEVTMEANPGTFEKERFKAFSQAGVTRLSLGIQSLNDGKLKALGRIHNASQARAAIEEAQGAFKTFNLDLMYALPNQTLKELQTDLHEVLSFAPPHLSIYHLTLEANTYFEKFPPKIPDSDLASQMLDLITEETAKIGLSRYEVSAYAQQDHQCVHNRNYWEYGDYLGIGAGAHGKLTMPEGIMRHVKYREPELYMQKVQEGSATTITSSVPYEEIPFEFMLGALRLKEGVPIPYFAERTGVELKVIEAQLQKGIDLGLLSSISSSIKATDKGFDFLSNLQELFLPN